MIHLSGNLTNQDGKTFIDGIDISTVCGFYEGKEVSLSIGEMNLLESEFITIHSGCGDVINLSKEEGEV